MPRSDPIPELKRQVAAELCRGLEGLSLVDAAGWIELDRWRVVDIRAGRLQRFSLETLIRLLHRLRAEVTIEVRHSRLFTKP